MSGDGWVAACSADDVNPEDVTEFQHNGRTFAIYHSPDGAFFASDGSCTHEQFPLADGFVMGDIIECAKHNGRFNYKTGKAMGAPACIDLRTYQAKVENGTVFIKID